MIPYIYIVLFRWLNDMNCLYMYLRAKDRRLQWIAVSKLINTRLHTELSNYKDYYILSKNDCAP